MFVSIKKGKVCYFSILNFGLTPQRETISAKCGLFYSKNQISLNIIYDLLKNLIFDVFPDLQK